MSSKKKETVTKDPSRPALVPKLRFPEYEGKWEVRFGSELFSQISERNPGTDLPVLAITQEHGAIPRSMIDYHVSVTESSLDTYKLVREGDFIISLRSFQGGIEYSQYQGVCSPAYVILRRSCQGIDDYYRQYLKTDRFVSILTRNLEGLRDGKMISYKQFSELPLPVPTLPEQQRIADCLSSLDELIDAQARKVDALKTHKKGLMQQLFPREGETQPRLRFPEFEGEWKVAPLATLLLSSPDYGVNAAAVPFSADLPKYLRITDISEDGRYISEKQVSVDLEAIDENYLEEGDIVLARTGASVGKSYQYRQEDGRLVFAGFLIRMKPHPRKLVSTYLASFLTTGQFWKWVAVTSARSGQPGINSSEYGSLNIPLPPTFHEQQRIADCLSSLDELITNESNKLETYKTHKKGLMQGLFPKVGEG